MTLPAAPGALPAALTSTGVRARPAHGPVCSVAAPCTACAAADGERARGLASLRELVAVEAEPLVVLTHLLRLCRDEHTTLWEQIADPGCQALSDRLRERSRPLAVTASATGVLSPDLRAAMTDALAADGPVPPVVVAHALAGLVDSAFAATFRESFRRRSPYRPGVGDPIPVDSPDPRHFTDVPPTSPPWRLAQRLDETRHVRLAGSWAVQFRIVFDYSLSATLAGLMGPATVIATCHPNRTLDELDLAPSRDGRAFPVGPADPAAQQEQIDDLIATAVAAGADIVVLPELAVTPEIAAHLKRWTRQHDGPRLLVAGSYHAHRLSDGVLRRSNTAVAWAAGRDEPLLQDKHSPADRPVQEDIQPSGWPEVVIHVTDEGWHLVLAVCRDLLNPHAVHALGEAGANLVLVPAMSQSLLAFGSPAAQLVGSCQAVVVIANNPANWSTPAEGPVPPPARALFGHPSFIRQTRSLHAPSDGPGVGLLRLGTAQVSWLAVARPPARLTHPTAGAPATPCQPATGSDPEAGPATGRGIAARPAWVRALAPLTPAARGITYATASCSGDHHLRSAAVLILLQPGPDGPEVLLTTRSPDLTHYPGHLAFPGGATEPQDGDATGTALREAAEEVGLDASCVEVLGCLPGLADPLARFLVTPVVAWTPYARFTGRVSVAEVSEIAFHHPARLLAQLATTSDGTDDDGPGNQAGPDRRPRVGPMTMALLDVLAARLTRS
ncbi:MAG: NUDIX domain-containing protein [Actinobacteria bacterium]|nr:NUDIX domain-containing protein [Actinomycetota bacterium]